MRVKLKVQLSGTRDGVPWPAVGSIVELPDDEARSMVYANTAEAVEDSDRPEPVVEMPKDVEEATERFVPETARHEPAVGVENLPDDDRRPDLSVVGLADDGGIGHGPANPPEALQATPADGTVDMAAEAESGEPNRRTKTPPRTAAKSAPLTTKTGPTKSK